MLREIVGRTVHRTKIYFLVAFVIVGIYLFNLTSYTIRGQSMVPTFKNGEKIICNKHPDKYSRGDVVTFKGPGRFSDETWVKRIIAIPGDTIYCKNNKVYVNDKLLEEDYVKSGGETSDFKKVKLKKHEYFLMGDNREHSTDSRVWGPFKDNEFTSVVLLGGI